MSATTDRLTDLQHRLQGFLLGERPASTTGAGPKRGLEVYANAYVARLQEALEADFPKTAAFLGEDRFYDLSRAYVKDHPSRHPSIRWVGRSLPDYLAVHEGAAAALARFEWALGEAFDAADAEPLKEDRLAEVPPKSWAGVVFRLQPSLRLAATTPSALDFWRTDARDRGEEDAVTCLVWRSTFDGEVKFRSLDADAAWMVTALRDGVDFGGLCEGLCDFCAADIAAAR
ncbi:MAG: putative DNA-binding domain-containing protein, partial [Rhodospirillales bacterium]